MILLLNVFLSWDSNIMGSIHFFRFFFSPIFLFVSFWKQCVHIRVLKSLEIHYFFYCLPCNFQIYELPITRVEFYTQLAHRLYDCAELLSTLILEYFLGYMDRLWTVKKSKSKNLSQDLDWKICVSDTCFIMLPSTLQLAYFYVFSFLKIWRLILQTRLLCISCHSVIHFVTSYA